MQSLQLSAARTPCLAAGRCPGQAPATAVSMPCRGTAATLGPCSRRSQLLVSKRPRVASRARTAAVRADAGFNPPPVSETKAAFLHKYPRPLPGIYDTVIQELLVQQHLLRYQKKYEYDKVRLAELQVAALGFVSVFDQIMEGLPSEEQKAVLDAFAGALQEDSAQYRRDAEELESAAKETKVEDLVPKADGSTVQVALAAIADRTAAGKGLYSKFLAIGLFRLLELVGAKDPKALESVAKSLSLRPEAVNRDLLTYKGVLTKLSTAKELMKEIMERERKKQSERDAEKAKKQEGKVDGTEAKVEQAVENPVEA